jgi:hypothetical protein
MGLLGFFNYNIILGFFNCLYFAQNYTEKMRNIIIQNNNQYPFCVAGINITGFLCQILNLTNGFFFK